MAAKNKPRKASSKTTKGGMSQPPPKLSTREQDLLWHMAHVYQLETSSLWENPILRRLKDNTEVRADANRSTIEALQWSCSGGERGRDRESNRLAGDPEGQYVKAE